MARPEGGSKGQHGGVLVEGIFTSQPSWGLEERCELVYLDPGVDVADI